MIRVPKGFRRTFWRAGLVLMVIITLLIALGLWLHQLERHTLIERELQQEQTRLIQLASEIEFIFLHAWQNGQYLAKLLDHHIQQSNGQLQESNKQGLQTFLISHHNFYRISVFTTQGEVKLDLLNPLVARQKYYASFKLNNLYYSLIRNHQVSQDKVIDLGMNEWTKERMLGLIYPIVLDEQEAVPGVLIILTSVQSLLPASLVAGDLRQGHTTILNDQTSALIGEIPDQALFDVLQKHVANKEERIPCKEDKLPPLHTALAHCHYQIAPIHLPVFERNWLLIKKYPSTSDKVTLRGLSWLLGACIVLLLFGFFALTYYFIVRKLERVAKPSVLSGSAIYDPELEVTDEKATKKVLVEANQVLHRLAHIDALTGLSNRRAFDFSLAREWEKAGEYHEPMSLIMIDVDYFKAFNDYYGHQAGDECLQSVAQVFRLEVRRMSDVVARYGGEEFALILPNTPLHDAMKIAHNLRQRVFDLQIPHKGSTTLGVITISCGVACIWPYHGYSVDDLLHLADQALYKAKHAGRNTVEG